MEKQKLEQELVTHTKKLYSLFKSKQMTFSASPIYTQTSSFRIFPIDVLSISTKNKN